MYAKATKARRSTLSRDRVCITRGDTLSGPLNFVRLQVWSLCLEKRPDFYPFFAVTCQLFMMSFCKAEKRATIEPKKDKPSRQATIVSLQEKQKKAEKKSTFSCSFCCCCILRRQKKVWTNRRRKTFFRLTEKEFTTTIIAHRLLLWQIQGGLYYQEVGEDFSKIFRRKTSYKR